MDQDDRFNRNELFFGKEGQEKLRATRCAVIGVGGLGTHVVQQLALLGVGAIDLVEPEELGNDNRNRYIGAWHTDPIPGTPKVELAKRLVTLIDPTIEVEPIPKGLATENAFAIVRRADVVFGCLDNEGARLILTEVCSAYGKTYIDLASDINPKIQPMTYGGRVHFATRGDSCLICMGVLDQKEAGRELETADFRRNRDSLYGVGQKALGVAGPSVVSINGVVASLAVTEFMVHVTGIRPARRLLNYYGHSGKVTVSSDEPQVDCYFCKGLWGRREAANVEHYIGSK
jgi:Dinucleotide-utilizing enzymes involved in molybdopterin and thiamine biosynthesis family 2